MSSRAGPRAAGSDGSDFTHREQVASQYIISARSKSKLKTCLYLNLLYAGLLGMLILADHLQLIVVNLVLWHYMWAASFFSSVLGLMALPRNRTTYLRLSNAGTVGLGMGGMVYGIWCHFDVFKEYVLEGTADYLIGGYLPLVGCLYGVFLVMMVIHSLTFYYANTLINMWDSKKKVR